jgi:hypothetical protein
MQKPALFFDGRNVLDGAALKAIGFVYKQLVRNIEELVVK